MYSSGLCLLCMILLNAHLALLERVVYGSGLCLLCMILLTVFDCSNVFFVFSPRRMTISTQARLKLKEEVTQTQVTSLSMSGKKTSKKRLLKRVVWQSVNFQTNSQESTYSSIWLQQTFQQILKWCGVGFGQ